MIIELIIFLRCLSSFLSVFVSLSARLSLSDPVSALEAVQQLQIAVIKMRDVEAENQKLREKLQEFDREVAEVKGHGNSSHFLCNAMYSYTQLPWRN